LFYRHSAVSWFVFIGKKLGEISTVDSIKPSRKSFALEGFSDHLNIDFRLLSLMDAITVFIV